MFLNEAFRGNITMTYFQGGHMMYTIKPELEKFTADVRKFYDDALR